MRCPQMERTSHFGLAVLVLALMPLIAAGQEAVQNLKATCGAPSPAWVPCGELSESTLSASADDPVPDEGSTLQGPNWSWIVQKVEYSDDGESFIEGGASETTIQNDTSANATLQMWFYQGAYWRVTCQVTVGYSETPGTTTWVGTVTCDAQPNSGELVSITVTSGATQTNVTGDQNWAAVKKSGDKVVIQVTVKPDTLEVANMIEWTNGTAVEGNNKQRTVDKGTSAMTAVKAQLGTGYLGSLVEVDIWILWATIEVLTKSTDVKPANAPKFGDLLDKTEKLGPVTFAGGTVGAGKICAIATLTPPGVNAVVKAGWKFRRDRFFHTFIDGVAGGINDANWVDDTSDGTETNLVPDANDKIYDIDGPNVAVFGSKADTQVYANFREYVQWNPTAAEAGTPPATGKPTTSDYGNWYWKGRWQAASNPQITLTDVGTGNITLPNKPAP